MIGPTDVLRGKILIVDDQVANVRLLERMLRDAGYVAVESTTKPAAVCGLHAERRYDLILLDLQMPGLDGFQVMEGLRKIETEGAAPVLVITAQPGHKLRALEAGARDFISKPFDLAEVLLRVHNLLEVRLLHLETRQLYERVLDEQRLSERLLLNVLPDLIAQRLKGRPEVTATGFTDLIADSFADATVLFADLVGFTELSERLSAEDLVGMLNGLFSRFDAIADERHLEKIKTIGDAYLAVAGLPVPVPDHTERAAHMALDMLDAVERFNRQSLHQLTVRIGLCSGAVVAGVIGNRRFQYDVWGDTVNTASRMQSCGLSGRIQMTDRTRQHLGAPFTFEDRGLIDVKGKGALRTWFLNGRTVPAASEVPRGSAVAVVSP